jgi:hypothetical protein
MKLKRQRFETSFALQRYSKQYSTALRKMTLVALLKYGKNDGITIYVPKGTILKEMANKIE